MSIAPGESLHIPLIIQYYLSENMSIQKTLSFDLRTSLYSDPTNFTFTVQANYTDTVQEKTTKSTDIRQLTQATLLDKTKISSLQNITTALQKSKYKKTLD